MFIDCIDMADGLGSNRIQWLDYLKATSTRLQFYGMSNGVAALVTAVQGIASPRSIDALRIWGHAYPGGQLVSGGTDGSAVDMHFSGISAANFVQVRAFLVPLAPLFNSQGRAELRGCSVGSGSTGESLLVFLASTWGVPVYGGTVVQTTGKWAQPVVCADPSGGLSSSMGVEV